MPGALNIPLRTLGQSLAEAPTDTQSIVYCASGHGSSIGFPTE